MFFFGRSKKTSSAPAQTAQGERAQGKFGQSFDSRPNLVPRGGAGANGVAREARSTSEPVNTVIVAKIEDLPAYVRFDDVGENSERFAALLVNDAHAAFLVIREDVWPSASASSLRQVVSRDKRYTRFAALRVTASVLSQLKAVAGRKESASDGGPLNKTELHVARAFEMISQGITLDASDIHLEVRTKGRNAPRVVQRMRMHGVLRTMSTETTVEAVEAWTEVIRGLYQNEEICAISTRTSTTWSPTTKQEGMLKPPVRGAEIRFESLPEKDGYDVALRINGYEGKSAARKSLAELGLSEEHAQDITRASLAPHGLVVVVGATGSGKTTTVTTTLALDTAAEGKKRLSLEIPPESDIPWLSQLVVTNETMKATMDGVMRADPDVISGGEVRNTETGQMAQDFSITGHLTWVTVHANNAFLAIRRLVSPRLGFDIDILTMRNFLRGVLYQALVGKLCPSCSLPAAGHMSAEKQALLTEKFELDINTLRVRHLHTDGVKCSRCDGSGVVGRTVVAELVVPTAQVLALLRDGRIVEAESEWRRTRTARFDEPGTTGKTYVEHALYKATQREVCAESLFELETLWTYEVEPLRASAADKPNASILSIAHVPRSKIGA